MKEQVIRKIEESKIITIVRGVAREDLIPLVQAMFDGGIRLVECTYDASGKISDEETALNIQMLVEKFGSEMLVGAGTVLTEKQVELTKKAGGTFIISPDTNEAVIRKTNSEGLVSIPGALTPTEIAAASRYGADFVKVFPAGVMGSTYIKDIKAPLSHIRLLAVGGVDEKNMNEFLAAGACGIGVSSGIVKKDLIKDKNFEAITNLARLYHQRLQATPVPLSQP